MFLALNCVMNFSIFGVNAQVCLTQSIGLFHQLCLNRVHVNFHKPGVNAQVTYPSINAQVIFCSELCKAWLYAYGFLPTPFEWSISLILIPGFNAQTCLVLHTGLFYILFLNRAGHFGYPGFNAQGFWFVIPGVLSRL